MSSHQANSAEQPAWTGVHQWRRQFKQAFPEIHKLPIVPSIAAWIVAHVRGLQTAQPLTLLDVGAGGRELLAKLDAVKDRIAYKSHDIDRERKHDYYDTAVITETFDIVASSEVIEHLDAAAKVAFVQELYRLTKPGGWVAITTPNAEHPTVFWRDFTHVMPVHYLDLAGLLGRAGYGNVAIMRLSKMSWKKRLRVWWYSGLLKLLHCDFAQSILAVAQKPR